MRRGCFRQLRALTIAAAALLGAAGVLQAQMAPGILQSAAPADHEMVQRGKYLVDAGDCVVCHTPDGGIPFSGGRAINTPFGRLFSSNLTPDVATGIGQYSDRDFYRALHRGVAKDGHNLYPAFPYTELTLVTPDDVRAIRAYLFSLAPVHSPKPKNTLWWPMSWRFVLTFWNWLFFRPDSFVPSQDHTAQWNRGAYLVEGLGHCGGCHTPRNFMEAEEGGKAPLTGAALAELGEGVVRDWFSVNLRPDEHGGMGNWSVAEIVRLLKSGRTEEHGAAVGPMAEVVGHSTQYLSDADLTAIAVYLKSLPPSGRAADAKAPDAAQMQVGEQIYVDNCQTCHQADGAGLRGVWPALRGSIVAESRQPMTGIQLVLWGGDAAVTRTAPNVFTMPNYGEKLGDDQIAAVLTYIGNSWGNRAPAVTAADVRSLRQ